jgi:hypothetical protein
VLSPFVARIGSGGSSSSGGGRTGSGGSGRFPESSIREEGPKDSWSAGYNDSYHSRGVNTLEVLGNTRVEEDEVSHA